MKTDELLIYRLNEDDLLVKAQPLLEEGTDPDEGRKILYGICAKLLATAGESGFYGNLWHCCIADLLVNHENIYSREAEIRGEIEGTVNDAVLHDMGFFFSMFFCDFEALAERWQVPELKLVTDFRPSSGESGVYNGRIRDRICTLAQEMAGCKDAAQMKDAVTQFYKEYGVGRFGLHKAFRVEHGEDGVQIVPIKRILHVYMNDLIGYESAKRKLIENTEAFLKGRPANNVLLFGEAGTGKSSCIKAISNEYYEQGLRIIEIYRHQFKDIHAVISQLKGRNYRFILYMDDLSFEEFETEYKYLKAVIEGGLEKKPDNILIYATSNRRHLIRENFSDRDGAAISDKHGGDTTQEKLSLAGRFGLSIYFEEPDFDEYQQIVKELAKKHGIDMDEEQLRKEATRWEMRSGSMSGRTAQQFIDSLLGRDEYAK